MQKRLLNIATTTLAILLTFSFVVNSAVGIENCMPKACCCQKAAALEATTGPHDGGSSNCHGSSPCCQIQPSIPFPDMAIVASPEGPMPNQTAMMGVSYRYDAKAHQNGFNIYSYTEFNLKIPLPPIYLQNQSFLC